MNLKRDIKAKSIQKNHIKYETYIRTNYSLSSYPMAWIDTLSKKI